MNDELLKDDPLRKSKKISMGIFVSALALLAIGSFASFHWLCADYFTFKANAADARARLEEIEEQIKIAESAASDRIAKTTAKADSDIAKCESKFKEAEAKFAARLAELDMEYSNEVARLDGKYMSESLRLEEELEKKKHDMLFLLKGYIDRFNSKTNDFEMVIDNLDKQIIAKRAELCEMTNLVARLQDCLQDLRKQVNDAKTALAIAIEARDEALKKEREAQVSFNEWNGKSEQVKGEYEVARVKAEGLRKEIGGLVGQTNDVVIAMAGLVAQTNAIYATIVQGRVDIEIIGGEIEKYKTVKRGLESEIVALETAKNKAQKALDETLAALDTAREQKREAESQRDKAIVERDQAIRERDNAEAALSKRKGEIDSAISAAEATLEKRRGEIDASIKEIEHLKEVTETAFISRKTEIESIINEMEKLLKLKRQIVGANFMQEEEKPDEATAGQKEIEE